MEAVNLLSRASDDACYLRFKTAESMGPFLYRTSEQMAASCPPSLPLTSECRGFYQGPASIDAASTYRNGAQVYNLANDYGRPQTELIERSTFRAAGEGRFSQQAVDLESSLKAPSPANLTCKKRQVEEREWPRWQYLICGQPRVEPWRPFGESTRVDVYCA